MNTLSIILIAMLGFLFALIVWAIIGTIKENRAIDIGMDYVEKFRKGEKPTLAFIKAAISDPSDDSAREGFATIAESLIIATWVQEVAIPSLIMCKTFDEVSDKHKHPLGGHAKQLLDSLNTLLEGTNAGKGMCLGEPFGESANLLAVLGNGAPRAA